MQIQKVVSKKGIEAWLVEDHSRPILSLQFGFAGGTVQDPEGKPGVATFVAGMLDEGAGDLDSEAFQSRLEDLAAKMSINASYDHVTGSFQTLTQNRDESFKLLRMALTAPHFADQDVERIREQLLANLRVEEKDPDKVASLEWHKLAFGSHPYARPTNGTVESVSAITPGDLRDYAKRIFARDNLKVAAVGDIDAAGLGDLLDTVFGDLPAKSDLKPLARRHVAEHAEAAHRDNAQSAIGRTIRISGPEAERPGFHPRLHPELCRRRRRILLQAHAGSSGKRGLAYSVYTYLYPLDHVGIFAGGVATENKSVGQSLELIKAELESAAKEGLTEQELRTAKDYLIGSFALRFDTSSKIAAQLLAIQLDDLGINYIERRNGEIEAVTVDDIKRVAKRLMEPKNLIVTVVGEPEGIKEAGL